MNVSLYGFCPMRNTLLAVFAIPNMEARARPSPFIHGNNVVQVHSKKIETFHGGPEHIHANKKSLRL